MSVPVQSREDAPQTVTDHVALPLYRRQVIDNDHGDTTIYMRVDEHGSTLREVSITIRTDPYRERSYEIEITQPYRFDQRTNRDYNLGLGDHASSAAQFADALQKVRAELYGLANDSR